jgi:hypothetical protein
LGWNRKGRKVIRPRVPGEGGRITRRSPPPGRRTRGPQCRYRPDC